MRDDQELEQPPGVSDSALKCKAAHDGIMDRVAELAIVADPFQIKALAEAFEHALTVFKPKVVWE